MDDTDTDNDGVPDKCDDCPYVFNPQQMSPNVSPNEDADGDGVGAACDNCPDDANASQANCNEETELAISYPGADAPPVLVGVEQSDPLNPPRAPPGLGTRRRAFKGDACDTIPCPAHQLLLSGKLPDDETAALLKEYKDNYAMAHPGAPVCVTGCSLFVENDVRLQPKASTKFAEATQGASSGVIGERWCDCQALADPPNPAPAFGSVQGRNACAAVSLGGRSCTKNSAEYLDPASRWLKVRSGEGTTAMSNDVAVGNEHSVAPFDRVAAKSTYWDFPALDVDYPGTGHVYNESGLRSVFGMLWTHTASITAASPPPGFSQNDAKTRGGFYGIGNATAYVQEGPRPGAGAVAGPNPDLECPQCSGGLTRSFTFAVDPEAYTVTPTGAQRLEDVTAADVSTMRAADEGDNHYIQAGEPLSMFPWIASGDPVIRAVTVNGQGDLRAIHIVRSNDGATLPFAANGIADPPILNRSEGHVLSSTANLAFVVGGTADGTPSGTPNPGLWTLDVLRGQWSSVPVATACHDDAPGKVLGTTYRRADGGVYFIDVVQGHVLPLLTTRVRLRRFRPDLGTLETLAILPPTWADPRYAKSWLVTSAGGALLFAATPAATDHHPRALLARFTFDDAGKVRFVGSARPNEAFVAAPLLWEDDAGGVTLFTAAAGSPPVAAREMALTEMHAGLDIVSIVEALFP